MRRAGTGAGGCRAPQPASGADTGCHRPVAAGRDAGALRTASHSARDSWEDWATFLVRLLAEGWASERRNGVEGGLRWMPWAFATSLVPDTSYQPASPTLGLFALTFAVFLPFSLAVSLFGIVFLSPFSFLCSVPVLRPHLSTFLCLFQDFWLSPSLYFSVFTSPRHFLSNLALFFFPSLSPARNPQASVAHTRGEIPGPGPSTAGQAASTSSRCPDSVHKCEQGKKHSSSPHFPGYLSQPCFTRAWPGMMPSAQWRLHNHPSVRVGLKFFSGPLVDAIKIESWLFNESWGVLSSRVAIGHLMFHPFQLVGGQDTIGPGGLQVEFPWRSC